MRALTMGIMLPSLYGMNNLWFCSLNHNKWLGYCGFTMDQNLKFYNVLNIYRLIMWPELVDYFSRSYMKI